MCDWFKILPSLNLEFDHINFVGGEGWLVMIAITELYSLSSRSPLDAKGDNLDKVILQIVDSLYVLNENFESIFTLFLWCLENLSRFFTLGDWKDYLVQDNKQAGNAIQIWVACCGKWKLSIQFGQLEAEVFCPFGNNRQLEIFVQFGTIWVEQVSNLKF